MLTDVLCVILIALIALAVGTGELEAAPLPAIERIDLSEARIPSTVDGQEQPIVVGVPESYEEGKALPLLVGLHTWSSQYLQMVKEYGEPAAEHQWLLVCPHFRGPNLTTNPKATQAGGSLLAQHDIIDAIEYMKANYAVDDLRIYIIGGSGGGHMTSLMCSKYPDVFAAGVAYCPITSLKDWHAQGNPYAKHVEAVCAGKPGDSPEIDFEYTRRSPRTFITNAANCRLLISHGDKDGTIWTSQSWETYAKLRPLNHKVVFESWSAGHVGNTPSGIKWLSTKVRSTDVPEHLQIVTDEAKSYFWLYLAPTEGLTLAKCTAKLSRTSPKEGDAAAQKVELSLNCKDAAEVRVDLEALGLQAPPELPEGVKRVQLNALGLQWPEELPQGVKLEGSELLLTPGAGDATYKITL